MNAGLAGRGGVLPRWLSIGLLIAGSCFAALVAYDWVAVYLLGRGPHRLVPTHDFVRGLVEDLGLAAAYGLVVTPRVAGVVADDPPRVRRISLVMLGLGIAWYDVICAFGTRELPAPPGFEVGLVVLFVVPVLLAPWYVRWVRSKIPAGQESLWRGKERTTMGELTVGDPAPDFALPADDGTTVTLSGLRGRPVVLYFYPKDDTPYCTVEACGFRDAGAALAEAGAVVLGVSADGPEVHRRFREKFTLPFRLLTDAQGTVQRAYGVFRPLLGRWLGPKRATFVIGPDGRLVAVFRRVRVHGHAAEVLAALRRAGA